MGKVMRAGVLVLLIVLLSFPSFARADATNMAFSNFELFRGFINSYNNQVTIEFQDKTQLMLEAAPANQGYYQNEASAAGLALAGCTIDGIPCTSVVASNEMFEPSLHFVPTGIRFSFDSTQHPWLTDGAYHTLAWPSIVGYQEGSTGYSYNVAGGSVITKFSDTNSNWVSPAVFGMVTPLSASISGPSMVAKGAENTWSAVPSGGVAPYYYAWSCSSGATPFSLPSDSMVPSGVVHGGPGEYSSISHTFVDVEMDSIQLQVWDSAGSTATTTIVISVGGWKPSYMAEMWRYDNDHYGFVVYAKAMDVPGSFMKWDTAPIYTPPGETPVPYAFAPMVNTGNYHIEEYSPLITLPDCYVLDYATTGTSSSTVVHVDMYDPVTQAPDVITFNFDLSSMSNLGAWVKSDGTSGSVLAGGPTWLGAWKAAFTALMHFLFVPSPEDVQKILPTSALASAWVPAGKATFGSITAKETFVIDNFSGDGTPVNVVIDLDSVPDVAWTLCRVATQVVIMWGLVFLMITSL